MLSREQRRAKEAAKAFLLRGPIAQAAAIGTMAPGTTPLAKNILGVGIGVKVTAGAITPHLAVRVYVRIKMPRPHVPRGHMVPPEVRGLPTDIVEVGDVRTLQTVPTWCRRQHHRPASCGVSVGHPSLTAGTLGCLVEKNDTHYILSNNHVLAENNRAHLQTRIIQPGAADGGASPKDDLAVLAEFKPIETTGQANDIDAALAEVGDGRQTTVEPAIIDIGRPATQTTPAVLYQSVRKHGRTTGHTVGVVLDTSVDLWVQLSPTQSAWFEEQIAIVGVGSAPFASGGDSGALIVDAVTLAPTALLFAGGQGHTFANPLDPVLHYFQVRLV